MFHVFKGTDKGYWKSEVKKRNQGFKRIYRQLPFRDGTLSVACLTLQFRNKDYQFLAEAVNGNGFVGLDENQYSIFISLLTVTLDFEKQQQRSILF